MSGLIEPDTFLSVSISGSISTLFFSLIMVPTSNYECNSCKANFNNLTEHVLSGSHEDTDNFVIRVRGRSSTTGTSSYKTIRFPIKYSLVKSRIETGKYEITINSDLKLIFIPTLHEEDNDSANQSQLNDDEEDIPVENQERSPKSMLNHDEQALCDDLVRLLPEVCKLSPLIPAGLSTGGPRYFKNAKSCNDCMYTNGQNFGILYARHVLTKY